MTKQGLVDAIVLQNSYLCVGLDTDVTKLPANLPANAQGMIAFNKAIIDATKAYSVSYKINTAFYESMGVAGWQVMEETLAYIPSTHFTIADAKRGDIGNTSSHYAKTFFETLPFDAITVAPYMGEDSIRPFLEYEHKTTIVLGLTSNKGADNFQQTFVTPLDENLSLVPHLMFPNHPRKLYEQVLETVSSWGTPDNLMFVIGATQAAELENVRRIIPNHFLLVPGVGFQGGSLADVTHHGANKELGLLVNVSRAILYASSQENFAEEAAVIAQQYQVEMAQYIAVNQQKHA